MDMHTDGNGAAGLLQQIFAAEITMTERVCQSCHAQRPIGAHLNYPSAGTVLRCPECGDVAATIVERPGGYAVSVHGTWMFADG
jgi:hypothetical protein